MSARAYINITGQISHLISFRITPDITRESALLSLPAGASVSNDSLVYRIKYAYAPVQPRRLDDEGLVGADSASSRRRWVDFDEGIYRYRFQGTTFAERLPLLTTMTSADAGVSFHYNLPSNYGDFHVGVYNGENYQRVELNNDKAFEFRGTVRPFATQSAGAAGHSGASGLLQRRLCRQRRPRARDGQRDVRTPLHQRRVRLPEGQGQDPGDRAGSGQSGLGVLGDAAETIRQRRIARGADPVRPLHAQHGECASASGDVAAAGQSRF